MQTKVLKDGEESSTNVPSNDMTNNLEDSTLQVTSEYVQPGMSLYWDTFYALIFTSTSFDPSNQDSLLLEETSIPPNLKLDTLYLFNYEEVGDNSDHCDSIPAT